MYTTSNEQHVDSAQAGAARGSAGSAAVRPAFHSNFQAQRRQRRQLEAGIVKFNMKAQKVRALAFVLALYVMSF